MATKGTAPFVVVAVLGCLGRGFWLWGVRRTSGRRGLLRCILKAKTKVPRIIGALTALLMLLPGGKRQFCSDAARRPTWYVSLYLLYIDAYNIYIYAFIFICYTLSSRVEHRIIIILLNK